MFGRQRAGLLAFSRRMTVAPPHRIYNANAKRRSRNAELKTGPAYQSRGLARESQRAPPIGDEPGRDTDRYDLRGPAEPREAEGDSGRRSAGPQWEDDRVGRRVELRPKLERRKEVADHRSGVGTASGNPMRRPS